ncbi:MAG: DUF2520 domain-containing protein [Lachnospiraceae bacterium]|nr:DUF2520 domain-containing protein [Lachnospiraceae bacterium]
MKIGFIGAGNVGCSLGRYLKHNQIAVAGYYSRSRESAAEAAQLTNTAQFDTIEEIVKTCDTLFLTVPDGQILDVWNQVKSFPIEGKVICHCSGAMSAEVFSGIHEQGAYGYSIHPMFPFNSKTIPYKSLQTAFISVEGDAEKRDEFVKMFENFGNPVKALDGRDKTGYHAAAVMASNQVVALMEMAVDLLGKCGFTEEQALQAIKPLAESNLANILAVGTTKALTGPVERNDVQTVRKHLAEFDEEQKAVYKACSKMLLHITERKYPKRDENEMKELLEE